MGHNKFLICVTKKAELDHFTLLGNWEVIPTLLWGFAPQNIVHQFLGMMTAFTNTSSQELYRICSIMNSVLLANKRHLRHKL